MNTSQLKIINVKDQYDFDNFLKLYNDIQDSEVNEKIIKQLTKDFFDNQLFNLIICYLNSEIAGFILFIDSYSSTYAQKVCYIEEFYIKQELQNQGFWTQLFQSLIDYTNNNNYKRIEWSTEKTNKNAINFYKKYNADNNRLFYKLNIKK